MFAIIFYFWYNMGKIDTSKTQFGGGSMDTLD